MWNWTNSLKRFFATTHDCCANAKLYVRRSKTHVNRYALREKGFRKGVVMKLIIMRPVKPNSGQRKGLLVKFDNDQIVRVKIPGENWKVQENGVVYVVGSKEIDVPDVHYKVVRNKLDMK